MKKIYSKKNVYDAYIDRLSFIFKEFDNVLVASSGGKDSGVLFNIAYDFAKEKGLVHKLAVYTMDYEADFEGTNKYLERLYSGFKDIKRKYWLCLPVSARCAVNMTQQYWVPWDKEKKDIWVREMPELENVVNEDNVPFEFKKGEYGADVRVKFSQWFSSKYGKTAVLVGIRTDESLNRLSILTGNRVNMYKNIRYSKAIDYNTFAFYPIYDWKTQDIWIANYKFDYDYNNIYDLMYYAGLSIHDMRVASPFNSFAQGSLKLYKSLSPNTWAKMVGRVNGVNFTSIYGGTTAMGWKNINKPEHFTWKEYAEFLLKTLPEQTRNKYIEKIEKSKWHWREQGGARDEKFIAHLKEEGWKIRETDNHSKACKVNTHKKIVYIDEMMDDTNIEEFRKAPTWKRVCISIMKNDVQCLYMGFSRTKKDLEKRKKAIEKYKSL